MNYIWEALLKADKEQIQRENIRFSEAKVISPYMEIAYEDLNLYTLPDNYRIEINPYYRFYEIFKDLFNINFNESIELRDTLFDILIHYLGELDLKQGINKEEFEKNFLLKDILNNIFGEKLRESIKAFENDELDVFLTGLITLYKTGVSLELFNKVLRSIFKNSIIYASKDKPKYIYIYLGEVYTEELKAKKDAVIDTFLQINMNPLIFWDKYFGVIGVKDTMKIDEIVMVK